MKILKYTKVSQLIILLINCMKNGLLLTLKQLIKLGVIKFKKKRKRRSYQKTTINTGGQAQAQSTGEQKYNAFVTTSSPNPQAYSDALRLRDENRNFDTRLLEYKNQQQEQKLLLDDQQQLQQQLQDMQRRQELNISQGIPIVNNLLARTGALEARGFAEDDNVDVTEVIGSENFKTQQDIADPELREPPPQPQISPSGSSSGLPNVEPFGISPDEVFQEPPPRQLLKYSSEGEGEYEDVPEDEPQPKAKPRKQYNTKKLKIKNRVDEYLKLYPDITEEKAKELAEMEFSSESKKKTKTKLKSIAMPIRSIELPSSFQSDKNFV